MPFYKRELSERSYGSTIIDWRELLRVLKKGSKPQEEKSDLHKEKKNPQEEKKNLQEEKVNVAYTT